LGLIGTGGGIGKRSPPLIEQGRKARRKNPIGKFAGKKDIYSVNFLRKN